MNEPSKYFYLVDVGGYWQISLHTPVVDTLVASIHISTDTIPLLNLTLRNLVETYKVTEMLVKNINPANRALLNHAGVEMDEGVRYDA